MGGSVNRGDAAILYCFIFLYIVFAGPWQNEVPKVTDRYFKEVSRIFRVLDRRLVGHEYMAGSEFSIADIAMLPWIRLPFRSMRTQQSPPFITSLWVAPFVPPSNSSKLTYG